MHQKLTAALCSPDAYAEGGTEFGNSNPGPALVTGPAAGVVGA
jgi:hypothetical protein